VLGTDPKTPLLRLGVRGFSESSWVFRVVRAKLRMFALLRALTLNDGMARFDQWKARAGLADVDSEHGG